ncbi:Hypothetical protein NGAL_HAMBI1146_58400 [Neorhizobium galegae bv. officinalis]|nr:Hypothetical protein NGAL_HAMBI1146_58400 [Neorhizobium galegae bv. officinalis]
MASTSSHPLPKGNPHLEARVALIKAASRRRLSDILVERVAIHNRAIAFLMAAAVYFALGFYAATRV